MTPDVFSLALSLSLTHTQLIPPPPQKKRKKKGPTKIACLIINISKITSNEIMICLFPPLFQSLNHNLNTKKLKEEEEKDLNSNLLHENVSNNDLYIRALKAKKVFNLSKRSPKWQKTSKSKIHRQVQKVRSIWCGFQNPARLKIKTRALFSTCSHKRSPLVKIACVPIGFTTICNPTCGTRHTPQV